MNNLKSTENRRQSIIISITKKGISTTIPNQECISLIYTSGELYRKVEFIVLLFQFSCDYYLSKLFFWKILNPTASCTSHYY